MTNTTLGAGTYRKVQMQRNGGWPEVVSSSLLELDSTEKSLAAYLSVLY